MIGIDANILVRIATVDDPLQARSVIDLIEKSRQAGDMLFVNDIVLCESV